MNMKDNGFEILAWIYCVSMALAAVLMMAV
jgi:hypothetical protein